MPRRGIPWGSSNPLWRWKHKRLNVKTHAIRHRSKTQLAKRIRRRIRSYRPRWGRRTRRHKDKRLSIIGTAGLVGSIFTGADGRMSPGEWFTSGRLLSGEPGAAYNFSNDLMATYTGIDMRPNMQRFSIPWGLVTIVATQIGAKVAQRFGGKAINNLPIVGKYVKW